MISKAEREHIQYLKKWSAEGRTAIRDVKNHPVVGKLLQKILPTTESQETVFDNIDWLITLMERELHTQGVKSLLATVEAHEKVTK